MRTIVVRLPIPMSYSSTVASIVSKYDFEVKLTSVLIGT